MNEFSRRFYAVITFLSIVTGFSVFIFTGYVQGFPSVFYGAPAVAIYFTLIFFGALGVALFIYSVALFKVIAGRVIAVLFILLAFSLVILTIVSDSVFPTGWLSEAKDFQIIIGVSSAGLLGGQMRYFHSTGTSVTSEFSLWQFIHSSLVGMFVALILFLVLRAGIIHQTSVDTFNIWGVVGVTAVTGFFSDNVLNRISKVYDELIGAKDEKSD